MAPPSSMEIPPFSILSRSSKTPCIHSVLEGLEVFSDQLVLLYHTIDYEPLILRKRASCRYSIDDAFAGLCETLHTSYHNRNDCFLQRGSKLINLVIVMCESFFFFKKKKKGGD